ncbi:MAG: DMT family transporter [Burkholderiales bacterium]|nr:DMT family transporter [Burkholderiales bacterium]
MRGPKAQEPRPASIPTSGARTPIAPPALRHYALLGLLSLLWGVSYNFAKVAVATIPPLTTTAARVAIAAVLLATLLRASGVAVFSSRYPWRLLTIQAVMINIVPWSMSAWAAQTIDSGLVAVLNSTSPIFAFFITWAITRHEPATGAKLAGALAGLAGVVLIVGVGVASDIGAQVPQQLACVLGAILFGIAAVHGRRFDALPPLVPATLTLIVGAAVLTPLSLVIDRPWLLTPSRSSLIAAGCLAVFSTAAALYLYYRILATLGSIAAASQSYLRIVFGVAIGIFFLGESLTAERLAGIALIVAGVIAMTRPVVSIRTMRPGDRC